MFGQRLAATRERRKLKQIDLAVALGVSQSVISEVERGRKNLRFETVIRAARELGVSIDYLAGLTDDPTPAVRPVASRSRTDDDSSSA